MQGRVFSWRSHLTRIPVIGRRIAHPKSLVSLKGRGVRKMQSLSALSPRAPLYLWPSLKPANREKIRSYRGGPLKQRIDCVFKWQKPILPVCKSVLTGTANGSENYSLTSTDIIHHLQGEGFLTHDCMMLRPNFFPSPHKFLWPCNTADLLNAKQAFPGD